MGKHYTLYLTTDFIFCSFQNVRIWFSYVFKTVAIIRSFGELQALLKKKNPQTLIFLLLSTLFSDFLPDFQVCRLVRMVSYCHSLST